MSTIANTLVRSTTLATLNAAESETSDDAHTEAALLVMSDTRQVSVDTTVTTMVMTSLDSRLPNLSLNDVLEQSGVNDGAHVVLQTDDMEELPADESRGMTPGVTIQGSQEAVQEVVDALESADAIVVEEETTNNVQSVTVRAADIDTLYTQALVQNSNQAADGHSNILLLNNGWAYTRLQNSPLELPVAPPQDQISEGWAMWRSVEEGVHEIQDAISGVWNRIVGHVVDTSPKTPADVAGVFKSYESDTQLMYTSSSTTTLKLSAEGVFTNTRTSLITSTDALPDVSYVLHTVSSPNGSSASFSGKSESIDGASAVVTDADRLSGVASDMFGAYKILEDGVTLELQFADGSVERNLFLKTQKGDLTVNGRAYDRKSDVSITLLDDLMLLLSGAGELDHRSKWMKSIAESMRKSAKTTSEAMAVELTPTDSPGHQASGIRHQASGIRHQASGRDESAG